jgi:AbrB family looped-hinge helix DNA binding protein
MPSVTISTKGQVTLPSEIRQHLGLGPGDQLLAEEQDGTVVLRPLKYKSFFEACDASAKLYKGAAIPLESMDDAWPGGASMRHKKSKGA